MAIDLLKYMIWKNGTGGGGKSYEKTVGPAPIISISDAKAKPAKSLVVGMEPVQDLHGYDSPWPAGGGVNILPFIGNNEEKQGVTCGYDEATQCYTLNGTMASIGDFVLSLIPPSQLPISEDLTGTKFYTLSVSVVSGSMTIAEGTGNTFAVALFNSNNSSYILGDTARSALDGYLAFKQEGTPTTGNYRLLLQCWREGTAFNNLKFRVQIEVAENHVPTAWSPYSNECPITGRTGVTVERTGKNLFSATPTQGKNIESDGSVVNAPARTATVDGIRVLAEQEYTVSYGNTSVRCGVFFYDDSNALISYLAWGNAPRTFTTPKHTAFVRFSFDLNTGILSPQLNAGSSALPYEPYVGTTYPVTWQTEAGTVYGGTVDLVSGELTVDRAMVDLGTLTWAYREPNTIFFANVDGMRPYMSVTNYPTLLSSMYPFKGYAGISINVNDKTLWIRASEGSTNVIIKDTAYSSAADFATAMSGVQLCYKLATPQTYQLTPKQIRLLQGSNVVWSDADDLTLTYLGTTPANMLGGMLEGGFGNPQEPTEETSEEPQE